MIKRKFRCAVSAVRMAFAIIPLAGCDGSSERSGAKLIDLFTSGFSTADVMQGAKPMLIEHRHYDIYTSYRDMFDGASEFLLVGTHEAPESRLQNDGMSLEGGNLGDVLPSCSMRMLLSHD